MPVYKWAGRTPDGETVRGEMEANDEAEVYGKLRKKHVIVSSIKEKPKDINISIPGLGGGIPIKAKVLFTRMFSTMINAGLPLIQCLTILAEQGESQNLNAIVAQITEDVSSGSTLADAMAKHPKAFDDLYVNMVNAGEMGGILDVILGRLSEYLEKADALQRKVKGALVYPAVVLVVAVGAVAFLLIAVIPTFTSMFIEMGMELPTPTAIVVGASDFLMNFWWALVLIIVGFGFAYKSYGKTHKGRRHLDAFWLKAPIIGNLLRKTAVARFTRTLGTLITSGVPIIDALEITARTAGNTIVEDAVMETRTSIQEGKTIAEPLKGHSVFPPMVVQMVAIGEATGALDEMLAKIADFYDDEVDAAVEALTAAIEPIMIVFLGGVVGGMVIAMYMPMFSLIGGMSDAN